MSIPEIVFNFDVLLTRKLQEFSLNRHGFLKNSINCTIALLR